MSSEYGNKLKISVFGQSHGKAVGVNIDGLPAGQRIDMDELKAFMAGAPRAGSLPQSGESLTSRYSYPALKTG